MADCSMEVESYIELTLLLIVSAFFVFVFVFLGQAFSLPLSFALLAESLVLFGFPPLSWFS